MSLYDTYSTDQVAEADGVWVPFGAEARVKIRRFQSKPVQLVQQRLQKPYAGLTRAGQNLPDEIAEKIAIQLIAEAVIVDWEGVTDREGNTLPNTVEAKVQVLTDLPDFRNAVANASMEREVFRQQDNEESAKN
jgi:hypothetical protein